MKRILVLIAMFFCLHAQAQGPWTQKVGRGNANMLDSLLGYMKVMKDLYVVGDVYFNNLSGDSTKYVYVGPDKKLYQKTAAGSTPIDSNLYATVKRLNDSIAKCLMKRDSNAYVTIARLRDSIVSVQAWVNAQGFLKTYTELDPVWTAEKGSYYTKTQSDARYLQSYTVDSALFVTVSRLNDSINKCLQKKDSTLYVTVTRLRDSVLALKTWVGAQGYLTSYTETDPVWNAQKGSYLTSAVAATTYVSLSGSYANPTWITSLAWSKLTGVPTTIAGYGITDATSTARAAISSTATGLTYTSGTGVFSLTSGYSIPTTTNQTNWTTAYTNRITSLTTTGSGAATLVSNVLNIPTPSLSGLGGIPYTDTVNKIPTTYQGDTAKANIRASIATYTPQSRTITINGTTHDLSANRTYTIPVLDTSIITVWNDTLDRLATKNNLNGYVSLSGSYANPTWLSSLAWSKVTSTPTTLSGYGITDATSTARAAISETVTGLDYNSTTGVISQTTGYVIPTTTQQTTWNNKPSGTGANTYIAMWLGASTLDVSPIRTDGSNVGIGVAADPSYKLTMNGPVKAAGVRVDNNDGMANSTLNTINIITNSGTGLTYNIPAGGYAHDFKEGTTNIMRVSEGKLMVGSITNRGTGKIEVTGGNISVKGLTGETYRWDATSGTPTNTATPAGWVRINIAGVDAWLPYYQ